MARSVAVVVTVIAALASVGAPAHAAPDGGTADSGVVVSTIPALPGVRVALDGAEAVTGADGIARFPQANRQDAGTRLEVIDRVIEEGPGARATLERTYGSGPDVTLAFGTERQAEFTFATGSGTPVSPDRIDRLGIRSSVGDVLEDVRLDQPVWLRSGRVVSTQNGPEERDISWSVEAVVVDGSNVVNRSEIRFDPVAVQEIEVPLLFFTARLHVRDAFFGFSHGGDLEITGPDGVTVVRRIPSNGQVVLEDMPRGSYELTVAGAGVRLTRPLVLSRNQEFDLELLSWLDLAAVVVLGIGFCAIPIVVGRRRRARKPSRRPTGGSA